MWFPRPSLDLSLRAGLLHTTGPEPRPAFIAPFLGVFVVLFPTVFYVQRFNKEMRRFASGVRAWKHILTGAPPWALWAP